MNIQDNQRKMNIITAVVSLTFACSNLSYLPYFTTSGRTHLLSYPVWILLLVCVILGRKLILQSNCLRLIVPSLLFCGLIGLFGFLGAEDYFGSELVKALMICLFVFFLGHCIGFSGDMYGNESRPLNAYVLSTLAVDAVVFSQYLRGSDLTSIQYNYISKNELAFLNVASIAILLFYSVGFETRIRERFRILELAICTVMVFLLRCRSMMVCVCVLFGVLLLRTGVSKRLKGLLLIALAALGIGVTNERFYNIFVNGILRAGNTAGDLNGISSGRLTQISYGFQRFLENSLTGTGNTRTIDCFYVSSLMQFGIIAGVLLIIIAFIPLIWGARHNDKKNSLYTLLIMCAVSFLIGGFFEEQSPFGPGVRCYILWFLFGYVQGQNGVWDEADWD